MSSIEQIPFTREGFTLLTKELEHLKTTERKAVIEAIAEARAHGDLKENAEYHAAREKQSFIEARIVDLEEKLARGQIVDFVGSTFKDVRFGAWVSLQDMESNETKRYHIVGEYEADISKNKLSIQSPMAKALLGKKLDELVEIKAPKGLHEYLIINIEY